MSKLNYTLLTFAEEKAGSPNTVSLTYLLTILSNYSGTPQGRIYEDGDVPGAFVDLTPTGVSFFKLEGTLPNSGRFIIEYKDDNGEKSLITFTAPAEEDVCFYDEGFTDFGSRITVTDSGVRLYTSPSFPGFFTSINGGTFKSTNGSIGAAYTFSELELLGATDSIDEIVYQYETALCSLTIFEDIFIGDTEVQPLEVDYTSTNSTASGADDGTITLAPTGGSGSYSYLWDDAEVTQNRSALAPGIYSVTITDDITAEEVLIEGIEITEPQVVPQVGSLLEVPILNSLRFVVNPVIPDNISVFQTPDNTLFKDQIFPRMKNGKYYEKVCTVDEKLVQFYSDFPINIVSLYNCDDELVRTFETILKENNIDRTEDYLITVRNHTDNPGKSRVYFNVGELPIPLEVGGIFEILNNADGFNGSYEIITIEEDVLLGVEYIVINKNYGIVASSSGATGRFNTSPENFNVYESSLIFTGLPDGYYYAKISVYNTDSFVTIDSDEETVDSDEITADDYADLEEVQFAESEGIHLKSVHNDTNLITYRCNDNCFNMTWSTGYIGKIRIESRLFNPKTGGERSVSRNSDYSLNKINAKKIRGYAFDTFLLPPWMHEKLSVIFDCDFFTINGVQYQTNEAYRDANYPYLFMLGDSSIDVEQVGWLDRYNSHDIGSIDDGGFLTTEQGFIKI